jgi:hypothetical protein
MDAQFLFVNNDGAQEGPMPLELVLALQDAGDLSGNTKVMEQGTGRWMTLSEAQHQQQQQQEQQQQEQQHQPTAAPKSQPLHPSWSEQWRPAQAPDSRTYPPPAPLCKRPRRATLRGRYYYNYVTQETSWTPPVQPSDESVAEGLAPLWVRPLLPAASVHSCNPLIMIYLSPSPPPPVLPSPASCFWL